MAVYRSPAKINLHLEVGPIRGDGYHSIRTLMVTIGLADTIKIRHASCVMRHASYCWRIDKDFAFTLRFAKGFPKNCRRELLKDPQTNLVVKAYQLLKDRGFRLKRPILLTLLKKIPVGAGLGGGSSNAAIALKAMSREMIQKPKPGDLEKMAARLGSDVNFFLNPSDLAWVTGRGDRLKGLPSFKKKIPLVIIYPGFGVSTKKAYSLLKSGEAFSLTEKQVLDKLRSSGPKGGVFNSFEAPAFRQYPVLNRVCAALKKAGSLSCGLAGSGSSIWAQALSENERRSLVTNLKGCKEFKDYAYYTTETNA